MHCIPGQYKKKNCTFFRAELLIHPVIYRLVFNSILIVLMTSCPQLVFKVGILATQPPRAMLIYLGIVKKKILCSAEKGSVIWAKPNSRSSTVQLITTSLIEWEVLRLVTQGSFEKVIETLNLPEARYSYLGNSLNNLHGNTQ